TGESFAVFGMFIDVNPVNETQDHELFEYFLQGWEATSRVAEEACAVHPEGYGGWGPRSVFESRQMRVQCAAPGEGIDPETVIWDNVTDLPVLKSPAFPEEVPHLYEDLPTPGYGIYAYRGGLTTPPCTEIVNWNLLDTPLYASKSQVDRLWSIILCMTEVTTCKHATIANEIGQTNRPVQPLQGRTIIHRCENGTHVDDEPLGVAVPIAPVTDYTHSQTRRCVLGGDGGPLMVCWVDTVLEHFALLYPMFVLLIGICAFYLLTRFAPWFPYTALMFIIGVVMGICSVTVAATDQLSSSIRMWENIGAENVLLGFLPGLIFRDAYTSNVFLFQKAFWQCMTMAFPMVLAGTTLTALVGYFILPYDWSWAFAMTFGAILSATDPVAVSALLNEVGAPPRLKIHISGESLLNDGSAIVFFTIFSQIFEYELGIPGFGTDITWGTGILLFLRMSLGAVFWGLCFGGGLLFGIYLLNRKFNYEESIVQVMATLTVAYLCYYTSEAVFGCSGVISVVTLGVLTKFYSSSLFNDPDMLEKFWVLFEHILNSVLFTLGGMVWGRIISNQDPEHSITFQFTAADFGYFVLVWALCVVIRYLLMFSFYPAIRRMGLGSNIKECIFMGWGGLRGAVGIALGKHWWRVGISSHTPFLSESAIHIDKHIGHQFFRTDPRRRFTTQLFGIVGGVALLTLVVNGTSCGPLLRKLGLAKTGETREAIAHSYLNDIKKKMFSNLLKLLGDPRFRNVNYKSVKKHISLFDELTSSEMAMLVKKNREMTEPLLYREPNLTSLKSFFSSEEEYEELVSFSKMDSKIKFRAVVSLASSIRSSVHKIAPEEQQNDSSVSTTADDDTSETPEMLTELRRVFVDLLDEAYDEQFENGEVDVRDVNMVIAYKTAVEVSRDVVASGNPIDDWKLVTDAMAQRGRWAKRMNFCGRKHMLGNLLRHPKSLQEQDLHSDNDLDLENTSAKDLIHYATGFIEAHRKAQVAFKRAFAGGRLLTDNESLVIDESYKQIVAAENALKVIDPDDMTTILAHLVCFILLNKAGEWIGSLNEEGLLKDQEAEHFLEEIQKDIDGVTTCKGEWVRLECAEDKKSLRMDSTENTVLDSSLRASKRNSLEIVSGNGASYAALKKQEEELKNMLAMTQDELLASVREEGDSTIFKV
ncbi:MAG: hypothetical protein SGILL_006933, partial [Bacillariaceae sp.]